MRFTLVTACLLAVGALSWGTPIGVVPSTAVPNPGSEITLQVVGAPTGAQFRWDFTGDGRPNATTNQPWASWSVPVGLWEVSVEVIQGGRVIARPSVAVVADAQMGAFRTARRNGDVVEVTVTVFAKQSLVAPAVTETVPPGWVASVLDDGGAMHRRGDVLEVLWSTSLDAGQAVQLVYALYPPAGQTSVRLSGTASAYHGGRRIETWIGGVLTF